MLTNAKYSTDKLFRRYLLIRLLKWWKIYQMYQVPLKSIVFPVTVIDLKYNKCKQNTILCDDCFTRLFPCGVRYLL